MHIAGGFGRPPSLGERLGKDDFPLLGQGKHLCITHCALHTLSYFISFILTAALQMSVGIPICQLRKEKPREAK